MPITLLDLALLIVMLISGFLAMVRGFMREILSIVAWVVAALVALLAYGKVAPLVKSYASMPDIVANLIAGGAIFLVTLLVVSVLTVRLSDMVLDSRVGALDRTLGFVFGLVRGLLIVVIAFAFFDWLVVERSQPAWVRDAKSLTMLKSGRDWITDLATNISPELSRILNRQRNREEAEPPDAPPETRRGAVEEPRGNTAGYQRSDRAGIRDLIQSTTR